ncbi:GNAT family N-acetyltransferase [Cohaesibacter celericrescens]|uniref:BioF2-like acetyltransferase domain-containing protein n=1 Tax=Cohaesibacter celericrescens TaxID=2067669 RepID=A0A2N5XMP5_9HYPH|nr:GNAT family N-acetyltransferase [Cohaesibacter celericrescens]PLW75773.1 hypothetical protein C0081_16810 [Cohaesibacter celericrescens]
MLELSVSSDFDYESAEYKALFDNADVTAFQHPAWQSAMQAHLRSVSGIKECTLLMRCKKSGMLVALVPLISRKKMGATILEYANLGLVDYAMPTLHNDIFQWIPDTKTLSEQLYKTLGSYDVLRIKHMPIDNPLILKLFPNSVMERADFSAHAAKVGPDYDLWRQEAISKSERKHRDKKRRAMMRAGEWQMKRLHDPLEIRIAFEYLRVFHKARYADRPGEDMMQDQGAFQFYVDLACKQAESGFARIYQFTFDDKIVAVQFGIVQEERYFYLMMGVDYDRMGRWSPGLLMTEDIFRDCIKDGMSVVDLTVGDEPYKQKFGTKPIPIYTLWHTHSMLGQMGRTVADMAQKRYVPERVRRWVS